MKSRIYKRQYRFRSNEEIQHQFYQCVKSKTELGKTNDFDPHQNFYYGDIDNENQFYIGEHHRQQMGNEIKTGVVELHGTIHSDPSGIVVEYHYKPNRPLIAVYLVIAILQFCVGVATISDHLLLAGAIMLLSVVWFGYAVFNPSVRKSLLGAMDTVFGNSQ